MMLSYLVTGGMKVPGSLIIYSVSRGMTRKHTNDPLSRLFTEPYTASLPSLPNPVGFKGFHEYWLKRTPGYIPTPAQSLQSG